MNLPDIVSLKGRYAITRSGKRLVTFTPTGGGPPLLAGYGPPVSVWDVLYEKTTGVRLDPGQHAGLKGVVTAATLHEEARHRANRPLRFTLTQARAIKNAYWSGTRTIASLSRQYHCTTVTIGRIVHGKTYWWA